MDDTKSANVALVIETMYQVAANPDSWQQLIGALADAGDLQDMPPEAVADMARSQDVARLTARPEDGPTPAGRNDIGWIVLSSRRKVLAANNLAREMMAQGLGWLTIGAELGFNDPGNAERAITVGSTHRYMPQQYGVSYFSSKGPTGDGRLKPELVAPGENVLSCARVL